MFVIQKRTVIKCLPHAILFWIANMATYIDPAKAQSYSYRFLDGTAFAATWASSVSILMKVFPNKVSTIIAWNEMFFGFGYTLGKYNTNVKIIDENLF